jgi:hypothetical protein
MPTKPVLGSRERKMGSLGLSGPDTRGAAEAGIVINCGAKIRADVRLRLRKAIRAGIMVLHWILKL